MSIYENSDTCQDSKRIKIYPDIMLAAARGSNPGAVRLWFLAKHYDNAHYEGSGLIPRKAFRRWVIKDLKWKTGTYDRYLYEAKKLGLFTISKRVYKLAAWEKGAAAVGVYHVSYEELIPIKQFAGLRWLAYTYAALVNRVNNGKPRPISAARLSELTGIPIRTIYHYDKIAGIKKQHNFAYHPSITTGPQIADEIFKGRNMWVDMQDRTLQRLPSTRTVPEKVSKAKTREIKDKASGKPITDKNGDPIIKRVQGMIRTINKKLNFMADSSLMVRVQHKQKRYIDGETEEIKNNAERKLISRYKKLARQDKDIPDHIYRFLKVENNAGIYLAI